MLRVPGSEKDLFRVKSAGGDVRVVYSPLDALHLARENPDRQVVFFGIGFETTAPANAMTVYQAKRLGVPNFSLLVSHVLVPPAIAAIMESPSCRVQAFLAAGHVCSVMGTAEYPPLAEKYRVPIVVTGFEPLDILEGIRRTVIQLEAGRHELENAYPRAVRAEGNLAGEAMLRRRLRGHRPDLAGHRDDPGQRLEALASATRDFDAETRFDVGGIHTEESTLCRSGEVLQGLIKPHECAAFGKECTPRNPLGATMVSSEGACAAYYLYRRLEPGGRGVQPGDRPTSTSRAGSARLPLRDTPTIVMGHGGGGAMSGELVEHLFLPAFGAGGGRRRWATRPCSRSAAPGSPSPPTRSWSGRCSSPAARSATSRSTAPSTTWPCPARQPLLLSTAFILEEGTALDDIGRVAEAMGTAARRGRRTAGHR